MSRQACSPNSWMTMSSRQQWIKPYMVLAPASFSPLVRFGIALTYRPVKVSYFLLCSHFLLYASLLRVLSCLILSSQTGSAWVLCSTTTRINMLLALFDIFLIQSHKHQWAPM